MTSAERPLRTSSQSSSEPSWLDQKDEIRYGSGTSRDECSATLAKRKSWRTIAVTSTAEATATHTKQPASARRALAIRRWSWLRAPTIAAIGA